MVADRRDLAEGDFEFVEAVVARLVDARRLTGRPDEEAGEEIGKTRVIVPVGDQATQQIGAPQEGRFVGCGAAENEVVAAAGAGMAAVHHEFLGRQTRDMGSIVEVGGLVDKLIPTVRRMDVNFDDAWIWRHPEIGQARVARWLVALHDNGHLQFCCGRLDGGDQFQVIVQRLGRRHENVEPARARFSGHRAAADPGGGLLESGDGIGRFAAAGDRPGHDSRSQCCPRLGLAHDFGMAAQRDRRLERVRRIDIGIIAFCRPWLRIERQAVAHRRAACR